MASTRGATGTVGEALESDELLRSWASEALRTIAGARRIVLFASPSTIARLGVMEGVFKRQCVGDTPSF